MPETTSDTIGLEREPFLAALQVADRFTDLVEIVPADSELDGAGVLRAKDPANIVVVEAEIPARYGAMPTEEGVDLSITEALAVLEHGLADVVELDHHEDGAPRLKAEPVTATIDTDGSIHDRHETYQSPQEVSGDGASITMPASEAASAIAVADTFASEGSATHAEFALYSDQGTFHVIGDNGGVLYDIPVKAGDVELADGVMHPSTRYSTDYLRAIGEALPEGDDNVHVVFSSDAPVMFAFNRDGATVRIAQAPRLQEDDL